MKSMAITRFENFDGNDRFAFPENYYRVTGGHGGEAILFFIDDIAVLYDCGMAYCYQKLLTNIKSVLSMRGKDKIDYILLSHTHYDHIGALPYVLSAYPEAIVCGARKCEEVFKSKTAIDTMLKLGSIAMKNDNMNVDLSNTNFRVDKALADNEELTIGKGSIICYETPGHTDCSMSYYVKNDRFLFSSESTGVLLNEDFISAPILKDYKQTIESALKLKKLDPKTIYNPHYGIIPATLNRTYFDKYIDAAEKVREFILSRRELGKTDDEIMHDYMLEFYDERLKLEHPKEAFMLNGKYIIKNMK